LLGGVLSGESFTLSQCYFFGNITDKPPAEISRLSGCCLDQLEAIPKPEFPKEKEPAINGAGPHPGATLEGLATGEHIYNNTRDYAARLIAKGLTPEETLDLLRGYLLGHKGAWEANGKQIERWQEVWEKLPRMVESGAEKFSPEGGIESEGERAAEWPEPLNILSELSAPELSPDDIPRVLAEFPAAFAAASGMDPTLTLSAAIAVAAAALSDEFQIIGDSRSAWFQQARLWVLAIARPGCGKTPAQRAMLEPLWQIHRELDQQWRDQMAAIGEETPKIPRPRVILADTTIEALSEALCSNPRGVLLANDEFESWLGSLDAYRRSGVSRDRGEWLRVFDGGPYTIERVQRGSIFVPNWGASILTATTPATLAKFTRQLPEDGLLQRFLPVIARRIGDSRIIPELEPLKARYEQTIRRLYNAAPHAHKGCSRLSDQAQEFFREWLKRSRLTAEAFGSIEPALESHFAKYATFLLRLSLTFHAANVVSQEAARDPGAFEVPLATVQMAAALLKRLRQHAMAVYLSRDGSETYALAREVARAILARGWQSLARRELVQGVRPFRAAEGAAQDAALRLLEDLGWLRAVEGGYTKPSPTRYVVNPAVPSRFRAIAEAERERRAAIRSLIADRAAESRPDGEA
jgi:hypothetical protein